MPGKRGRPVGTRRCPHPEAPRDKHKHCLACLRERNPLKRKGLGPVGPSHAKCLAVQDRLTTAAAAHKTIVAELLEALEGMKCSYLSPSLARVFDAAERFRGGKSGIDA